MIYRIPVHEFNAGKIFPVSHGLLEQRFVHASEVLIDLERNDTIVPNSLLAGSGGTFMAIRRRGSGACRFQFISHD